MAASRKTTGQYQNHDIDVDKVKIQNVPFAAKSRLPSFIATPSSTPTPLEHFAITALLPLPVILSSRECCRNGSTHVSFGDGLSYRGDTPGGIHPWLRTGVVLHTIPPWVWRYHGLLNQKLGKDIRAVPKIDLTC